MSIINTDSGTAVLSGQPYASGETIEFDGLQTVIGGTPAAGDQFTITPSTRQDLFATFDGLINALEAPSTNSTVHVQHRRQVHVEAQQRQALNNGLNNLNRGLDHLLESRARIGARVNGIDNQEQANEEFMVGMEQIRSDIDGLDYAEAASRLSEQLLVLQAAQQSFVKTQNLSLFNYIR